MKKTKKVITTVTKKLGSIKNATAEKGAIANRFGKKSGKDC